MVILFIIIFVVVNLYVGLIAARLVRTPEDYLLAGRRLPFALVTATLFATWFGSETILGASSEFVQGGLLAVIRDPFGAALCLLLVGMIYARPLYKLNLLTLGDFFNVRYNRLTEKLASVMIILPYLSWIAAQYVAFGIILQSLTGLPDYLGFIAAGLVVTIYTFIGGMWSVSVTDFLQTIFILLGLVALTFEVFNIVDIQEVLQSVPVGFFRFHPEPEPIAIADYFAAWITIGLGSIAGQDIFQRVMASKNASVAYWAPVVSGMMYLTIGLLPLFLALVAKYFSLENLLPAGDSQMIIPVLVLQKATPLVQVLFFSGLLSAILSTASSALLAPAAILSENLIRPHFQSLTDKQFLMVSRLSVILISIVSIILAWIKGNVYALVGLAASLGLVSLFIPLTAGLFWKKANAARAIASMITGVTCWILAMILQLPSEPVLYGLAGSILGLVIPAHRLIKTN